MQKVDLKKVLDMLVNEEQEGAEGLLHQWFVEKTKSIHENLMQEDDDVLEDDNLSKGIKDDQDDIDAEEYYGEGDEDEIDTDATDAAMSDVDGDDDNGMDDDGMDMDSDMPPSDDDEDHQITGDGSDPLDSPEDVLNQFADLQSDLARLKDVFTKMTSGEDNMNGNDMDSDIDGEPDMDTDSNMSPMDNDSSEEDFDDLGESFMLEPVAKMDMVTPKYSGKGGSAPATNSKSPIPQNKPENRVGGKAVEIRAKEYKGGMNRETSPTVKVRTPLKNQVKNSMDKLEAVPSMGPKGALLNTDTFGNKKRNDKSLLGSTGTDLRGNFMKRK